MYRKMLPIFFSTPSRSKRFVYWTRNAICTLAGIAKIEICRIQLSISVKSVGSSRPGMQLTSWRNWTTFHQLQYPTWMGSEKALNECFEVGNVFRFATWGQPSIHAKSRVIRLQLNLKSRMNWRKSFHTVSSRPFPKQWLCFISVGFISPPSRCGAQN